MIATVAAAITMQTLVAGTRKPLSEARQRVLEARFLMNSVKNAEKVIDEFIGND